MGKTKKITKKKQKSSKKGKKKQLIERKPPKPIGKPKKDYTKDHPKIQIDWEQFDKLASLQCTLKEFAFHFNCSEDTIENRVMETHGVKFSEYYGAKRQNGFISLRRLQYQSAQGEKDKKGKYIRQPNVQMQINLGQQWLGQTSKSEAKVSGEIENQGERLSELLKDPKMAKHMLAIAEATSDKKTRMIF